ncbi:Butyrophilin subfamily 1 member A1, partial [Tinamus guttatus]
EEVFLDPDTAHPRLMLSQDCRSVRWTETRQNLPYRSERFERLRCVLGREGFSEGRHCWAVEGEVGDETHWAMGVAAESVWRKTAIAPSPLEKIWAVQQKKGTFKVLTASRIRLSLSPVPKRIWVVLDCILEQVTFVSGANGDEIFTFRATSFPEEKIYPWLMV